MMIYLVFKLIRCIFILGFLVVDFPSASDSEKENPPIVRIPELGTVIGYYKTSEKGKKYAAYEGIPYVQQPQSRLRFKDPVPSRSWIHAKDGVLNATKQSDSCAQYTDIPPDENGQPILDGRIIGSEDCLYLNIYVPISEKKMPVIFFIHGGAFMCGSGNSFGPKYLADKDLILVTINYRLGLLGFLSTQDQVVPGNLGLKDQVTALRWVNQYIEYFGGDSKKITLVGFSAGSASVQYHYLSPMSRGLFHAAIGMSGTALNPFAYQTKPAEKAKKLGALLNCPTNDSARMINCLRKVPVQRLVNATTQFQVWQYNPLSPFAPVIEKPASSKTPFLTKSPKEIFEAKESYDVPAVYGAVSEEGCFPGSAYASHDNLLKELNDNWKSIIPHLIQHSNNTLTNAQLADLAEESRQEYFSNESISKKTAPQLLKMLSDQKFLIGFEDGIRLQANASKSPVYFYYFTFKGSQSYSHQLSHTRNNYGVCHTDDAFLVFENSVIDPTKTKREWTMSNFLMNMWMSVASSGIPETYNNSWTNVDPNNPSFEYFVFKSPKPNFNFMSGDDNFGNKKFWKNLDSFPSLLQSPLACKAGQKWVSDSLFYFISVYWGITYFIPAFLWI